MITYSIDPRKAAHSYLAAGISVIPIKADGSKSPALNSWKHYQTVRANKTELESWFNSGQSCGIGLVCGKVSGNLEVLDFDKPGIYDEFAAQCAEHGLGELIELCLLVETPSGGRHLIYRCLGPVSGNQKLAQEVQGATIKTLIETRGEGGYVLASGSPTECHPANRPYRFLRGRPSAIPTISTEDRANLHAHAILFNRYVKPSCIKDAPPSRDKTLNVKRPGDDYNERGDYEAVLEQHGWRRLNSAGGKTFWQRPGKSGKGISATSNYADRRLFYVFSSNAAPFEPNQVYPPFSVYTILEHGGDFSLAASELANLGYGEHLSQAGLAQDVTVVKPRSKAWPVPSQEMFYGLVGDIVRSIEPHSEADPVALLTQFLVAFGNVIGRSAYFPAEADKHYGNIFLVLVGVSSKGRKGSSLGHIRCRFDSADRDWRLKCEKGGLSSGEGLIFHVRDPVEAVAVNKTTKQLETVIEDPGVSDKRLLVVETEFTNVLRQTCREGNTLSATIRNAWDTGTLQTLTKNCPMKSTDAHISIVGHITDQELKRELSATETANGFGNRFLWICVRRSKELPEGGNIDSVDFTEIDDKLRSAIQHAKAVRQVRRDDLAREIWHKVYHDLSSGKPGLAGVLCGRSEAQVMRLALLYCLLDCETSIRAEHLTAALALWEYCEASVAYIFGESLGDKLADEILQALRRTEGGMTRTQIRDLFQRNQSSSRVGDALALLLEHMLVRCDQRLTEGTNKPLELWIAVR